MVGQQRAIAEWSRMSYGWMGRTPDYKASLMNSLGANAEYWGKFADNARAWHKRAQESALFMNHAIVNPPVDRSRPAEEVKDVYVSIQKETDAGIYVSGAKVVATSSALTHYNFLGQNAATATNDLDFAVMFILPMDAPGCKLFCRNSYEQMATLGGSPFDYPLSSRFDENDAIFVLENVFVPWEDVLVHRDLEPIKQFHPKSGFLEGFCFQGCTRYAVKLEFISALVAKALHITGADVFRGNQALLGEIIALRDMFWAFSDAMLHNPTPWVNGTMLPNLEAATAYRAFAPDMYPRIKIIVDKIIASALIYLPSSVKDFANPNIDPYLQRYVRGSNGIDYKERIKVMKLLWDCVGTEFAGRHGLYEANYAGNHEEVRIAALQVAQRNGRMQEMTAMVDRCLADYDEHGWTHTWINPERLGLKEAAE
jgi:4-hydroxyphenylacetate 3-monooxygenase